MLSYQGSLSKSKSRRGSISGSPQPEPSLVHSGFLNTFPQLLAEVYFLKRLFIFIHFFPLWASYRQYGYLISVRIQLTTGKFQNFLFKSLYRITHWFEISWTDPSWDNAWCNDLTFQNNKHSALDLFLSSYDYCHSHAWPQQEGIGGQSEGYSL